MKRTMQQTAERLFGAQRANADDAAQWRWLADLMEERRLEWRQVDDGWAVKVDGAELVCRPGFDDAMRAARVMWSGQAPAKRRW